MDEKHEEEGAKAFDAHLTWRLLQYLRPYRWRAGFSVFLVILSSLFEIAGPAITAIARFSGTPCAPPPPPPPMGCSALTETLSIAKPSSEPAASTSTHRSQRLVPLARVRPPIVNETST